MELIILSVGIVALCGSSVILVEVVEEAKFEAKKKNLVGRIVRISDRFITNNNYVYKYGKIDSVNKFDKDKKKIQEITVACSPNKEELKRLKEKYDADLEKRMSRYNNQLEYQLDKQRRLKNIPPTVDAGKYDNGYSSQRPQMQTAYLSMATMSYGSFQSYAPQKPVYDFSSQYDEDDYLYDIPVKDLKLMPKNFDMVSGMVMKKLNPAKKGGDKKNMKRWPRIFRFALYLAVVWLAWDFVINANTIALFLVHSFIK